MAGQEVRFGGSVDVTKEREDGKYLEGYALVFDTPTKIGTDMRGNPIYESIDRNAIDLEKNTRERDIVCLYDHDGFALGRMSNGTLVLQVDSHGLWFRVKINEEDSEAVNIYNRVKRGDVYQCSARFKVPVETGVKNGGTYQDGTLHIITKMTLIEVGPNTLPAYTTTSVQARGELKTRIEMFRRASELLIKLEEVKRK